MTRQLTEMIEREGDGYVSFCPELNIASQGATADEARSNLKVALELFFEAASDTEIERRLCTRCTRFGSVRLSMLG